MIIKMILSAVILVIPLSACVATPPTSHLSVQIIDDIKKPVEGVLVEGGFSTLTAGFLNMV